MSFTGPYEDRLAIRELLDAYDDAVIRFDVDAWRDTWAEDAEWEIFGNTIRGREAIVSLWQQTMARFEQVVFRTSPGAIEIDGDRASGRAYADELLVLADGTRRRVRGSYDDRYVRADGAWRFQARRYRVLVGDGSG